MVILRRRRVHLGLRDGPYGYLRYDRDGIMPAATSDFPSQLAHGR